MIQHLSSKLPLNKMCWNYKPLSDTGHGNSYRPQLVYILVTVVCIFWMACSVPNLWAIQNPFYKNKIAVLENCLVNIYNSVTVLPVLIQRMWCLQNFLWEASKVYSSITSHCMNLLQHWKLHSKDSHATVVTKYLNIDKATTLFL